QVNFVKGGVLPADLKHSPMEYVQMGKVFCGIEQHEGAQMTKAVIDILGDGVLMYESDFPHPECTYPDSTDNVLKWAPVLGEEATRKLMYDNAANFLRLLSTPFDDAPAEAAAGVAVGGH